MKKLYLSSYLLGNEPSEFAELAGENKKTAIIMNAADVFPAENRPKYRENEIAKLKEIGLEAEELDLRDYFGKKEELDAKLNEYGLVWGMGGNSFVLRRAMWLSGFDEVAVPKINNGLLVYGGFSAAAVAAGSTLRGIELVDDPDVLPEGYEGVPIIWDGLGLYDKSIAPHYRSDHPESEAIDGVVAYFEENNMPYTTLSDGEVEIVAE